MSTITKQIAAVEFHANSRQANAALESIRSDANEARKTIQEMQAALNKGITTMKGADGIEFDVAKKLREATKEAKAFEYAAQSLVRGVKAFDELWKNAKLGTIENLTGQQIKAGMNAAKVQMDRLKLGNEEDRAKARAIQSVLDEGQKVLNRMKIDTDQIIHTMETGGKVAEEVLLREQRGLREMLKLTEQGSDEWHTYYRQLDNIEKKVKEMGIAEKQLRGEIVTREDAMRVANQQDKEATDRAIEAAEKRAAAARGVIDSRRKDVESLKEAISASQKDLEETREAIAAKKEEADAISDTASKRKEEAAQRADAARKAKTEAKDTAKAEKEAYASVKKEVDELDAKIAEVQGRMKDMGQQTEKTTRSEADSRKALSLRAAAADKKQEARNLEMVADRENAALQKEKKSTEALRKEVQGLEADLQKLNSAEGNTDPSKKSQAETKKLKGDIEALTITIGELKKKRDELAASQKQGAETSIKDGEAVKMTAKEATEALTAMSKAATFHVKTDGTMEVTNREQAQQFLMSQIKRFGAVANNGDFIIDKPNQQNNLIKAFQEKYGMEGDRKGALDAIRNVVTGKGGLIKSGWMEGSLMSITPDKEAMAARVEKTKELLAISKGTTQAVKESTQATKEAVNTDKEQAVLTSQINLLEEQKLGLEKQLADAKKKKSQATKDENASDQKSAELSETLRQKKEELAKSEEAERAQQEKASEAQTKANAAKQEAVKLEAELQKMVGAGKPETGKQSAQSEEERKKVEQELADLQQKRTEKAKALTEQEAKYNDAQAKEREATQSVTDAVNAQKQALKDNKEARQRNRKELEELQAKEQAHIDTMQREQAAMVKATDEINRQANAEALANNEINQLQTNSIEKTQQAIEVLEKENKTIDANGEQWKENERTIGMLNERLNTLKQQASELRGETMSLADAEELASKAGTDGFFATGEQMKQATAAIDRQRESLIKTIQQKQKDGAATKDEEAELKRLEKVLKDLKFEQDNFNMSHKRMDELLKAPKSASDLEELRAAIKRADGELKRMKGSLGENNKAYQEFAAQVKNAKIELKQMEGQAKATTSAFDKAWDRFKTYVTFYVSAAAILQKVMGTMGDLMDLSDRMGEVRKTTGMTADEVGRLSDNLSKMDVRTPLQELMSISASAGQLGLKSEEDILGFTEAANKLMVALPEMGKEAATEMMRVAIATGEVDKIRKQLEEGTIEGSSATAVAMEKIASTIDRLRASSASTAPEITDFIKRVGAVGAQSGISIDQMAALGSTVSSLGMRVEMSATALSRMIPAIRNNAFDVAKAIGVTPETLRNLFDTGHAMEAILMIFQHIKDQNMDEDSVEKMLGMGGMQEVMKELNQMGARAGIVFAGLSQNVDELRRQLGVSAQAYEENVAIQQEFDRMNDTTAAKWERLKNQIEETIVGDSSQRFLGGVIDALRVIVDFITGNIHPALTVVTDLLKTLAVYWAALKIGLGEGVFIKPVDGLRKMKDGLVGLIDNTKQYIIYNKALSKAHTDYAREAIKAEMAQKGLNKALIANLWTALAAAVVYLTWKMYEWIDSAREGAREAARFQAQLDKEQKGVNDLTESIGKARVKMEDANREVQKAEAALKKAKRATDGTTESANQLAKAESNLLEKEEKKKQAMAEHKQLIESFNSQYSKYLGFMLSEVSSNLELARARDLVNSKLRETITLKRQEAALERIEKEKGEDRDEKYSTLYDTVGRFTKDDPTLRTRIMAGITKAANSAKDRAHFEELIKKVYKDNGLKNYAVSGSALVSQAGQYFDEVYSIREATNRVTEQFAGEKSANREMTQADLVRQGKASFKNYANLLKKYKSSRGGDRAQNAANLLKEMDAIRGMQSQVSSYYDLSNPKEAAQYKKYWGAAMHWTGYNRNELIKEAGDLYKPQSSNGNRGGGGNGGNGSNPWGSNQPAESTDWKNMSAEALVQRRKQMNQFVNAIQTDSDVKSVLKEDSALKAAIEKGMSSDMRTVIEWYNTERLKIQDELHARHLTNTGDWMDPKKQRVARKQFQNELKAYLEELDAYYTERKTRIQEAGNDDGVSQAEVQNRTLANEAEWRQRRAELQKLYGEKNAEVTRAEQEAIFAIIAERTGDTSGFVEAMINKTVQFAHQIEATGERGKAMVHKWFADLGLRWERDFLKGQQAVAKGLKAIQDIIDKERPFNGITKNLRENLVTMGILTADMTAERNRLMKEGEDLSEFDARQAAEELRRTTFMLGEAENAYTTTVEQVMQRIADAGMTAWAAELRANPKMQEGLMAQLRATYDAVQEAIKKEASLMKKQAEIMWNNILLPGGDGKTTIKQAFERTIAQLGLAQGRVSRANSLIGAGQASDRVADRLAIKQMQLQLTMQEHYFNVMRKQGLQRLDNLRKESAELEKQGKLEEAKAKRLDAEHVQKSLNLAMTKEETELAKQREEIIARTEESEAKFYKELKEWSTMFASSMQSLFEASHAGDPDYYNELAKLNLTGKGGPGAGTYVVIENSGTEDATAHYEYLDERQALERQREIENQNAVAEAWEKVWDDFNNKINETITDQMNAMLQNASVDANTNATLANTEAIYALTGALGGQPADAENMGIGADGIPDALRRISEGEEGTPSWTPEWQQKSGEEGGDTTWISPLGPPAENGEPYNPWATYAENFNAAKETIIAGQGEIQKKQKQTDQNVATGSQSAFAKMTQAANLYGIAYQAMSNDNLSAAQKFSMIALQSAGQAAITGLTVTMSETTAQTMADTPSVLSKLYKQLGWGAIPVFAAFTGLLGGLMGLAASQIAKSKSQISQATGASISAGRLATGMLTYAEGNVNEFTDPSTLTPGHHYNVDAADGKTYRAKYTGANPKTHITNGPEFHLVGEAGREAIIDAHTTRLLQMDETGIWSAIQTLYNGGGLTMGRRRKGRGVAAFADGNLDDFADYAESDDYSDDSNLSSLQASIDRQSDLLEDLRTNGIKAFFDVYGKGGLVDSYDRGKKNVQRHGEKY